MPISKRQYKLGWLPDQDDMNGDPEGLLRMDNLTLDEMGILSLTRGTQKESASPFPGAINTIYSRVNDLPGTNVKLRYVHVSNGAVYRNYWAGGGIQNYGAVFTGGDTGYCAFGTGFGHNFIGCGTQKWKDDGNNAWSLGIRAPLTTVTATITPPRLSASGATETILRTVFLGTRGAQTEFDLGSNHGFEDGFIVRVRGFQGEMWKYANNDWFIKKTSDSKFTIDLDTRAWPSPNGTPEVQAITSFNLWDTLSENGGVYEKDADYIKISANETKTRCVAQRGFNNPLNLDTTNFQGTPHTSSGEDMFKWNVRPGDSRKLVKVRIDYLLDAPTSSVSTGAGTTEDIKDYYWFEWTNVEMEEAAPDPIAPDNIPYETTAEEVQEVEEVTSTDNTKFTPTFQQGINVWTQLTCKRSDFNRVGNDDAKDWSVVKGIKVTATFVDTLDGADIVFNDMFFEGSISGPLTGTYVYIQVDVNNTGTYLVKSKPSPISSEVTAFNCAIQVYPQTCDFQANECWIYRAGGTLNGFYLVKKITGARGFTPAPFIDNLSDTDAILDQDSTNEIQFYLDHPPDNMVGMEGPFADRMWYLTQKYLYPSFPFNPDGVDIRTLIQVGGVNNETALFVTKVSNDTLLVGTTNDIYEITGDATEVSPGILNIQKKGLGIKQPPTNRMFAIYRGALIYFSRDGWMMLQGSTSTPLVGGTSQLYRGKTRHGIDAIRIPVDDDPNFPVVVSGGKLFCSVEHLTIGRALMVYTFPDQLNPAAQAGWRWIRAWDGTNGPIQNNPNSLFVEEDGTILAGTQTGGDGFLRSLGTVSKYLDGSVKQGFYFATVFDPGESAARRKDSFTLKVEARTFGDPITIRIQGITDNADSIQTMDFTNQVFNNKEIKYYDISTIGLVKRYQIVIASTGVMDFSLYDFRIEYDLRPEQLNFLRIPPSNYGIAGRKRIPEIPFVIDTLGQNVTFTPILDNTTKLPSVVNRTTKGVYNHQFISDEAAFDIGGTLQGNVFEFYELVQPREVELLPDQLKFKHIPYTNLGNGSRKRFVQYAFIIDTRGGTVTFTPLVDGTANTTQTYITSRKQTVIYTFATSTIGIDIGGTLSSTTPFEFYGLNLEECISEKLPPLTQHMIIPYNDLGNASRKRMIQFAFTIDTFGQNVTFTPLVDGLSYSQMTVNTNRKQTVIYTYDQLVVGVQAGGTLLSGTDFEFYGIDLGECASEKLPPLSQMLHIPYTNLNTSSRKRFIQYAFIIDTMGQPVTFTPFVDGTPYPTETFTTFRKQTCIYTFATNVEGIDIGGTLTAGTDFEFYGPDLDNSVSEKLPPAAQMQIIPCNNLGTTCRKRFIQYGFVMNARGGNVTFTPSVDGVDWPSQVYTNNRKQTCIYTFDNFPVGIDICGKLESATDFEFYNVELSECLSEKLPPVSQTYTIPYTNLRSSARKRFIQYAFTIDTRGVDVLFIPRIDGIAFTPQVYNTARKETVIYTFDTEAIGIDIGGSLSSTGDFEFYGVDLEESVTEKLPPIRSYQNIGCTNFGSAGKKRIRTWPFVIDTRGKIVTFNPTVDGVPYPSSTHVTNYKQTVFHYFDQDVFGVDFCATLSGTGDFEFYNFEKPENVETLPVGKLSDQFGPIELPKVGKLYSFRSVLLPEGTSMNWKLYAEDTLIDSGSFATVPNKMDRYVIKFQKFRLAKIFRMEFSSSAPFHTINGELETNLSGNDTEKSRIKIREEISLRVK